jgi:hypothetical protein
MGNLGGALAMGALVAGGGVAGYLGGRWLIRSWGNDPRLRTALLGPQARNHKAAPSRCPVDASPPPAPDSISIVPGPVSIIREAQLPLTFDWIFEQYRGQVPIEYLRALAMRESGMQVAARSGAASGLLQIVDVVRRDYNRVHGTRYERDDLLDPVANVAIATWLLHAIIRSYTRNHPNIPNLHADWDNPRFVELLTFGWNAGWSERGGVGRVARYLEAQGTTDITIDLVCEHALAAGASRQLSRRDKVRWCKSVVALYQKERRSAGAARVAS